MRATQRHEKILKILKFQDSVRTSELAQILGKSTETIRNDLEVLEKRGYLSRVHGGAVLKNKDNYIGVNNNINNFPTYISFNERFKQNISNKHAIALAAANLVQEGQSIALDSGTTSFETVLVLLEKFNNLTIVTNSLKIACEVSKKPSHTLIMTGGVFSQSEYSFVSDFASLILEKINVDIMFLSPHALSIEHGATTQLFNEAVVNNKMRKIAKKLIVLADSSKFEKTSLIRLCNLSDIDIVVTDSNLDQSIIEKYRDNGCNLIVSEF
ncbi:MAG TPA: DeoR/GlpR transcriptional regulator [Clostridiaceae bacterium]|nr:DeoR/GlpR transcriptional regulator [Clostridiaceae bacterium]